MNELEKYDLLIKARDKLRQALKLYETDETTAIWGRKMSIQLILKLLEVTLLDLRKTIKKS